MEYPKAFNCLTRIQFHSKQGRSNDLDERVQGKFLKGSFLGSKMDCFFGDGVGGLPCICTNTPLSHQAVNGQARNHRQKLSSGWNTQGFITREGQISEAEI